MIQHPLRQKASKGGVKCLGLLNDAGLSRKIRFYVGDQSILFIFAFERRVKYMMGNMQITDESLARKQAGRQGNEQAGAIVSIECVGLDLVAWRENDFHAMLQVVFG